MPNAPLKMDQRLRVAFQAIQRQACADPDNGVFGVDLSGALISVIGAFIVALTVESRSFAIPGMEVQRVYIQRLFIGVQCLGVLLLLQILIAFQAFFECAGAIGLADCSLMP